MNHVGRLVAGRGVPWPATQPEQAEAAAYYVVAEGLANTLKHAGAQRGGGVHAG